MRRIKPINSYPDLTDYRITNRRIPCSFCELHYDYRMLHIQTRSKRIFLNMQMFRALNRKHLGASDANGTDPAVDRPRDRKSVV